MVPQSPYSGHLLETYAPPDAAAATQRSNRSGGEWARSAPSGRCPWIGVQATWTVVSSIPSGESTNAPASVSIPSCRRRSRHDWRRYRPGMGVTGRLQRAEVFSSVPVAALAGRSRAMSVLAARPDPIAVYACCCSSRSTRRLSSSPSWDSGDAGQPDSYGGRRLTQPPLGNGRTRGPDHYGGLPGSRRPSSILGRPKEAVAQSDRTDAIAGSRIYSNPDAAIVACEMIVACDS